MQHRELGTQIFAKEQTSQFSLLAAWLAGIFAPARKGGLGKRSAQ